MLGMVIGDSWGHVCEFMPLQYNGPIIVKSLSEDGFNPTKKGLN